MPTGILAKTLELLRGRKKMGSNRKKPKKSSPHYRDPSGVDAESVAGKMRARNKKTQSMLDELD